MLILIFQLRHIMKTFSVILLIACSVSSAYSQLYVRVGGGYSFDLGSNQIGDNYAWTGTSSTREAVYGSFGSGVHGEGAVGVAVAEHLSAEIAFGYLAGASHELTLRRDNPTYTNHSTETFSSTMFTITPAVIVSTEIMGITPYSRFGVTFGFPRLVNDGFLEETYQGVYSSHSTKYTEWGGVAIGLNGSFGVSVSFGGPIVYGEVRAISMSWNPVKWKVEYDNTTREGEYKKKTPYILESSSMPEQLQPSHPFGSLGFVIGVMLQL
jgi:hypothetical protein